MTILPNGNVGIGESTPINTLSVVSDSNTSGIQIRRNSNATNDIALLGFKVSTTPGNSVNLGEIRNVRTNRAVNLDSDLSFHTYTNNALGERLRIRDDGLVGINETSPSAQLQVKSGATNRVPLIVDIVPSNTANLQEWRVNGVIQARISDNAQFFGVGVGNQTDPNNSRILFNSTGTEIRRNVANSDPALIVNLQNASATGDIARFQKASVTVATVENDGSVNTSKRFKYGSNAYTEYNATDNTIDFVFGA
jgi:hypothetical protein